MGVMTDSVGDERFEADMPTGVRWPGPCLLLVVTLLVSDSDAATIANLAASGRIAVTLLPKEG
jgi:hypothetical protein